MSSLVDYDVTASNDVIRSGDSDDDSDSIVTSSSSLLRSRQVTLDVMTSAVARRTTIRVPTAVEADESPKFRYRLPPIHKVAPNRGGDDEELVAKQPYIISKKSYEQEALPVRVPDFNWPEPPPEVTHERKRKLKMLLPVKDIQDPPKSMYLSYDDRVVNGYFDETWLNHALFMDNRRSDDLRERMYEISQKSRTYQHHRLPADVGVVSYEGDVTPRPICVPFLPKWMTADAKRRVERRIYKKYLRFNEMIYLEKRHLPFCSHKHDKYHLGLEDRMRQLESLKHDRLMERANRAKNRGEAPKVSGLPKIKRKPPTVAQNPFQSDRKIERTWLKTNKQISNKKQDNEEVVVVIDENDVTNDKVVDDVKSWVVDSVTMTSQSFLSEVAHRRSTTAMTSSTTNVGGDESSFHLNNNKEENISTSMLSSHATLMTSSSITVADTARVITKSSVSVATTTTDDKACLTVFDDDDVRVTSPPPPPPEVKRPMTVPSLQVTEPPEVEQDEGVDVDDGMLDDDVTDEQNSDCDTGIGGDTMTSSEQDPSESRNLPPIDESQEKADDDDDINVDDDEEDTNEVVEEEEEVVEVPPPRYVAPPPKLIEDVVEERPRLSTPRKKSVISIVTTPQPPATPSSDKNSDDDARLRMLRAMQRKKKAQDRFNDMKNRRQSIFGPIDELSGEEADDRISNFLEPYCIIDPKLEGYYERVFTTYDEDGDGYLTGGEALEALDYALPDVPDADIEYIYRILELANLPVFNGRMNQNLFNVVISLTRRINSLDDFMRGLLDRVDFQTLDSKFFVARKLFERLIDNHEQQTMSIDCLLWEIQAGGLSRSDNKQIRRELSQFSHFSMIDFLTYLPLFTYIHSHVMGNPLEVPFTTTTTT